MKFILFYFVFFVSSLSIYAEACKNQSSYRIIYNYEYTKDSINSIIGNDIIYLEANQNQSYCFSYYSYQCDSLKRTPEGKKIWRELFLSAIAKDGVDAVSFPHKRSTFKIFKNLTNNDALIKDEIDGVDYEYTQPIGQIDWTICDSIKNIQGYSSIQAIGYYHGRIWNVWFCPDLPLNDGPWLLNGLPGLILEAKDTNNLFSFTLIGIEECKNPIRDWIENAKATTREEFLKRQYQYLKNSISNFNAEFDTNISTNNDTRYLYGLELDFKH